MPPTSKILMLPDEVISELDDRLRASDFGDVVSHSEWLKSKGFDISKTTIGAYSKRNRQRIRASGKAWSVTMGAAASKIADQRIECLKVAVSLEPSANLDRSRSLAETLLNWAYGR